MHDLILFFLPLSVPQRHRCDILTQQIQTDSMIERKGQALKWTAFGKSNLVLPLIQPMPMLASKRKGFSCCWDKVEGWRPPASLLKELDQYEVSVQLSMSLFNLSTASFYGSTWMGVPVLLKENLPDIVDFNYGDIVYALTRVSDPSCVGIIEIVVSKKDKKTKIITAQYGYEHSSSCDLTTLCFEFT